MIDKNYVLLAWDKDKIAGVLSFSINQSYNFERLTTVDSARIEGIGAIYCPIIVERAWERRCWTKHSLFAKRKEKHICM